MRRPALSRARLVAAPLAAALLLAAGCATTPAPARTDRQPQWQARQSALTAITGFSLQGRLAERGLTGNRGDLDWTQNGAHFEVRISGPLGVGALVLSGVPEQVEIRSKEGIAETNDPSEFMRRQLGWSLPIARLRYWVLGLPAPASAAQSTLDERGRAATLRQDSWQVDYAEYQTVDRIDLPRKIDLANGEHRFRLVIDRWAELRMTSPTVPSSNLVK